MFLLGEDTTGNDTFEFEPQGMVGEAEELATMGHELSETASDLTMSYARLEFNAYREQNDQGTLSEATSSKVKQGKGEFFKRILDAIKTYWNKFVDYLRQAVSRIVSFFTKQTAFVRKNREKLQGLSDSDLKSVKFDRQNVIADPAVLTNISTGAGSYATDLISKAEKGNAAKTADKTFVSGAIKAMKISGDAAKASTVSAAIRDAVNGVKDKDAVLTTKDVANSLKILQDSASVQGVMRNAESQAKNAIRAAEARAKMGMTSDGREKDTEVSKSLQNLRAISGRVGPMFSAAVNSVALAAGSAKTVLSRALASKSGSAKQEDGIDSILDQYA